MVQRRSDAPPRSREVLALLSAGPPPHGSRWRLFSSIMRLSLRPARGRWRLLLNRVFKLCNELIRDREVEWLEQRLQGPSEDVVFGSKNPP